MANDNDKKKEPITSAEKRANQAKARNLRNRANKGLILAKRKNVIAAIEAGNKADATKAFQEYTSTLDRAAKKGAIAKNTANRKKSRMALAIAKIA